MDDLTPSLKVLEREREQYWDRLDPFLPLRLEWRAKTARCLFHALPGETILELGCGTGRWTRALLKVARGECPITAVTFSEEFSRAWAPPPVGSTVEVLSADTLPGPLEGRTFDYVVSWQLVTPENLGGLLQTTRRVLKPGGHALFFTSNRWNPYRRLRRLLGKVIPVPWLKRGGEAMDKLQVFSRLSQIGYTHIAIFPYDFLYPPIPRRLVFLMRNLSLILENMPGVRNLAGDLYITARNPAPAGWRRPIPSLATHASLRGAVSVVVPCRNEAPNVPPLVEGLLGHYGGYLREILIVDDGSRDATAALTDAFSRRDPRVKLIRRGPPHGVGWALRAGISAAQGEWILLMDADFTHLLPEVRDLFDRAAEGHPFVVGSRFSRESVLINYPFPKIIANRVFHVLVNLLLRFRVRDVTNNLKLARRRILQEIPFESGGFSVNAETGLIPLVRGHAPCEVPISWINRTLDMGRSHFRVVAVGPGYLRVLRSALREARRRRSREPRAARPLVDGDAVRRHYRVLADSYPRRANRVCQEAYETLVGRVAGGRARVLEVGCGAALISRKLTAPLRVGLDFSREMLAQAADASGVLRVQADAARLPVASGSFDVVFSVNLLEHVPRPERILDELARALAPGGRCLVITPNGDRAPELEGIERLGLKLPEGPHRFLRFHELARLVAARFELTEHARILPFPGGPAFIRRGLDEWTTLTSRLGLFQYALGVKQSV